MTSIPSALIWEMFRRGRWRIILSMFGALALPILLLTALRHDGLSDPQDIAMLNMHVLFIIVIMFSLGSAVFDAQGRMSKLYAYPLRTSTLVAWRMLPAMAIVALQMVLATALINLIFDVHWPVWGPAATAAVAFAAVDAVAWLTEKSIHWLIIGLTVLAAALGIWFRSRYGFIFSGPPHYWREVSIGDALTMLAIGTAAYGIAVAAVARNRRGDPPISIGLADRLNQFFESVFPSKFSSTAGHFGSPFRAQCWLEWQRKGWVMPFSVFSALPFGLAAWVFASRQADDLLAGFFGGAIALPLFALVVGGVFGGIDPNDAKYTIGHFLATRPMSDTDLARAILRTASLSVVLGWAIWAFAFAFVCGCVAVNGQANLIKLPPDVSWLYFPATLLLPWIVASVTLSLGLLGRPKVVLILLGCILGGIYGSALASKMLLSNEYRRLFNHTLVVSIGAALLISSAVLFSIARRRGLMTQPVVWTAAVVWLAVTLLLVLAHPAIAEPRMIGDVFAAGIAALIVVPLAATPLAISLNRHR